MWAKFNKFLTWQGWQIIKWAWGVFFLFFVLNFIWHMQMNKNYDQQLLLQIKEVFSYSFNFIKEFYRSIYQ